METMETEPKKEPEVPVEAGTEDSKNVNYQKYLSIGGVINEADYMSALARAKEFAIAEYKTLVSQAKGMAQTSGIDLGAEASKDPRVALYSVLRNDTNTSGEKHHHSQMDDQRLFVEVLRMLGEEESVAKFTETHPHISFEYGKEGDKKE